MIYAEYTYMNSLEYNGISYKHINGFWVDDDGIILPTAMQNKLNSLFARSLDLSSMTVKEIIEFGDEFRDSSSFSLANKCYEHAAKSASKEALTYLLPRMTSCYRSQGMPQKAIDILTFASKKYGQDIISVPMLTSAAAAYCDMSDYKKALKCCNRAYRKSNNNPNEELKAVYGRIKANIG